MRNTIWAIVALCWLSGTRAQTVDNPEFIEQLRSKALIEAERLQPKIDRFNLYTNCQSIGYVPDLSIEDSSIELSYEDLYRSLESRFRSILIYDASASHYVWIDVRVVGSVFLVEANFNKLLYDPITSTDQFVTTWESDVLGTHGHNGDFILYQVYRKIDEFLAEYLRVNTEQECTRKDIN